MKASGETKLLLILGLIVLIGGGALIAMNRGPLPSIPGTEATPPPLPNLGAAEFEAILKEARHLKGDPNAKITVVEFADFECPSCRKAYNEFLKGKKYPVRFAFRHYPLPMHSHAVPAALATEAAERQGKFWEMYEALFEGTETELTDDYIRKQAEKIGLDLARFDRDIKDPALNTLVKADSEAAHEYNIEMTPTFLVRDAEGKIHQDTGAFGLERLLPILQGGKEPAQKLSPPGGPPGGPPGPPPGP